MWPKHTLVVALIVLTGIPASAEKPKNQVHSWDVLMNQPEAREQATKLLGHCGDAQTQDVMNACFMLEFKNADQEMNQTYGKLLETLEITGRQKVRTAQRAWLNYRDLHCDAVGALQAGGGSLEPTEVFSCKADLTKARTKEFGSYQSLQ